MAAQFTTIAPLVLPPVAKATARNILVMVQEWLAATFTSYEPTGLRCFQLNKTDQERAALTEEGNAAKQLPVIPVLGAAATQIDIARHNILHAYFAAFSNAHTALRGILVASLGEHHMNALRIDAAGVPRPGGTSDVTPRDMILYIRTTFAAPSLTYRNELLQQLGNCFPTADFEIHIGHFTQITCDLIDDGWQINDAQRMAYLTAATQHHPSIVYVIARYHEVKLQLTDRNYVDMAAYIRTSLNNNPVGAAPGIASAAIATPMYSQADMTRMVNDAVNAALAKALPVHHIGTGRTSNATAHITRYCYSHGHCGHNGAVCTLMTGDNRNKYSDAMRAAKTPTEVPGGSQKKYGPSRT